MSFYPKLVCVGSLHQKEFSNSGMLGWLVGTVKNSGIFSRLFNHLELETDTVVGAPWNWLKLLITMDFILFQRATVFYFHQHTTDPEAMQRQRKPGSRSHWIEKTRRDKSRCGPVQRFLESLVSISQTRSCPGTSPCGC